VNPGQPATATAEKRPLRVIDHVGNSGGGIKYVLRLSGSLATSWDVSLHAQPVALERYRQAAVDAPLALHPTWPMNLAPVLVEHSPRFARWLAETGNDHRAWSYRVRRQDFHDRGVFFFPWLHRHDLHQFRGTGLGVFHDAIFFQLPELIGPLRLAMETDNLRTWFANLDRIVVTSQHTKRRLLAVAGEQWADKVAVIPVADFDGERPAPSRDRRSTQRFGRYLVMPAVASPHKNHRLLLTAMRRSKGSWNLVLTGNGTTPNPATPLGTHIAASGIADRVFGLGHVSQELVADLIANAEALVMPTLGEGGGSFPVCEAIVAGTPVICSNLDVIEEQLERMNARATLFDARNEDALVQALDRLAEAPAAFRQVAVEQLPRLRLRTWAGVAADFSRLLAQAFADP
jgi:glycosyltransferase involved in cell wall biosynthesis